MSTLIDTRRATCTECGYTGSLRALEVHSCYVQEMGGRCEDYPCCGHTDGDGCQTLPEHTSAFYLDNPQFLYEPGTPEWFDYQEQMEPDEIAPEDCEHDDWTFGGSDSGGRPVCDNCGGHLVGPLDAEGWF